MRSTLTEVVTDVAIRDHVGYNIPENKTLLNMKGKAKKAEGVVLKASKKPAKKRAADPEAIILGKVAKKTNSTPLASSLSRRIPQMRAARRSIEEISREEVPETEVGVFIGT
jgi:hypothetical protein